MSSTLRHLGESIDDNGGTNKLLFRDDSIADTTTLKDLVSQQCYSPSLSPNGGRKGRRVSITRLADNRKMFAVIGPVRVSIFSVRVGIFTHPVIVSYLYNEDKNLYRPVKENQTNAAPAGYRHRGTVFTPNPFKRPGTPSSLPSLQSASPIRTSNVASPSKTVIPTGKSYEPMYGFSHTYWSLRLTAPILAQMHQIRNRTIGILGEGVLARAQYPPFRATHNNAIGISIYKGQYGTSSIVTNDTEVRHVSQPSLRTRRLNIHSCPSPSSAIRCLYLVS